MTIGPNPTTDNILRALGTFLTAALPADVAVVQGQLNRVPEIPAPRFVIMSPPRFERIETNVDTATDSKFTASIASGVMTVTAFAANLTGAIQVGSLIFGAGLAVPTTVTGLGTGTGGTGTYAISPSQSVSSETMSAGRKDVQMNAIARVQLDFHSNDDTSGDLANTVSALFRDEFATDQFANQSPNYGVAPLYADDARQLPFTNDQQQVEWRWVVECLLQANIVVSVPQQFSDSVELTTIDVDANFPPSVIVVPSQVPPSQVVVVSEALYPLGSYTVGPNDQTVFVISVPFEIDLPTPTGFPRMIHIKNATSVGAVTVVPQAGLIDGNPNLVLGGYEAADLQWSGTEWFIF